MWKVGPRGFRCRVWRGRIQHDTFLVTIARRCFYCRNRSMITSARTTRYESLMYSSINWSCEGWHLPVSSRLKQVALLTTPRATQDLHLWLPQSCPVQSPLGARSSAQHRADVVSGSPDTCSGLLVTTPDPNALLRGDASVRGPLVALEKFSGK